MGPLPPGWEAKRTADGKFYYLNHSTKTTSWEDPRLQQKPKDPTGNNLGPLPLGWEAKRTADGKVYFLNHNTKNTTWEDPRLQHQLPPNGPPLESIGAVLLNLKY